MNGYVKVQDAYEAICDAFKYDTGIDREAIKAALSTVQTIEVREVVHGEWIYGYDDNYGSYYYCSVCGEKAGNDWDECVSEGIVNAPDKTDYCPSCGAYMRRQALFTGGCRQRRR